MASDAKSSKSVPRTGQIVGKSNIKGSKSGPINGYEPMRHTRPAETRPNAVEQVRQIEEIRQEKEFLQRAFS